MKKVQMKEKSIGFIGSILYLLVVLLPVHVLATASMFPRKFIEESNLLHEFANMILNVVVILGPPFIVAYLVFKPIINRINSRTQEKCEVLEVTGKDVVMESITLYILGGVSVGLNGKIGVSLAISYLLYTALLIRKRGITMPIPLLALMEGLYYSEAKIKTADGKIRTVLLLSQNEPEEEVGKSIYVSFYTAKHAVECRQKSNEEGMECFDVRLRRSRRRKRLRRKRHLNNLKKM